MPLEALKIGIFKGPVQYYCIGSALEAKPLGLTPNMYIYLESGDQGGSDSPGFRSLKFFLGNGEGHFSKLLTGAVFERYELYFGGLGIYI